MESERTPGEPCRLCLMPSRRVTDSELELEVSRPSQKPNLKLVVPSLLPLGLSRGINNQHDDALELHTGTVDCQLVVPTLGMQPVSASERDRQDICTMCANLKWSTGRRWHDASALGTGTLYRTV